MKKELEGVLAKRTLFFTKVIFTILVINILISTNYLDFKEDIKLKKFLNLINSVSNLSERNIEYSNFELERVMYLIRTNPNLATKHRKARKTIVDLLEYYNKEYSDISRYSKGEGSSRNMFVAMINLEFEKNYREDFRKERIEIETEQKKVLPTDKTVNEALDFFLRIGGREKINVITGVNETYLREQIEEGIACYKDKSPGTVVVIYKEENNYNTERNVSFRFAFLYLDGDSLVINFTNQYINQNVNRYESYDNGYYRGVTGASGNSKGGLAYLRGNQVNTGGRERSNYDHEDFQDIVFSNYNSPAYNPSSDGVNVKIPVTIETAIFPSTLYFAGYDSTLVSELFNNLETQQTIRRLYGNYNLSAIDKLSEDTLKKISDSVSVLGFDISRKWFPVAISVALVVLYSLLYKTIKKAKSNKLKIITCYDGDDPLEFLIEIKWLRFLIWFFSPVFLLLITFYTSLIVFNPLINTLLIINTIACILLGVYTYRTSLNL